VWQCQIIVNDLTDLVHLGCSFGSTVGDVTTPRDLRIESGGVDHKVLAIRLVAYQDALIEQFPIRSRVDGVNA